MSSKRTTRGAEYPDAPASQPGMIEDPTLEGILSDFRSSVHAWSEAVYNRPRPPIEAASLPGTWRRAAAWSVASVLVLGILGGGIGQYEHRQAVARVAAERQALHVRQLAEQRAREAEVELARIDSAVARQVPHAMEPLARLMVEDDNEPAEY